MNKKITVLVSLIVFASLLLSACAPATAPAPRLSRPLRPPQPNRLQRRRS